MWRTDALTSRITAAKTQWLRRGAIVLLGLLIAGVSVSSVRLYDELSKLSAADRDNVEWTLGQLDVDLLRFEASVKSVRLGDRTLADMRQHFDILYSRIRTISDGTAYGFLPKDDVSSGGTAALDAFLGRVTPLIDSPDDRLIAEIETLEAEVTALRPRARALTLNGLSKFTAEQMAQRERVVDTLMIAAVVGLTLITALAVSIVGLDRQRILLTRRSEQSDRIGNRLRATTNAALDAIVVADVTGTIVDWNAGAEAVFGIDRAAALGRRMTELIIPERFREAHDAGMERYRRTGVKKVIDAGRVELAALRGDGSEFPVELTIAAAESDDGPIFVSYLRDISLRLMAHEALTTARDAAQSAERAKSEFLAVMSHEMRTPLNGVLGVLDILARSDLDDRQRKFLQIASTSGEVLLRHINDVLDITKIEAGRMDFTVEPISIDALVEHAVEVNGPVARNNGNTITQTIGPGLNDLSGDPHRIRQVLINLLGNAAKFTTGGRIKIVAHSVSHGVKHTDVEFVVEDNGPGIPKADRERIFDDFVTLDASYERRAAGSGLGLGIARRVVEGMGGSIWMDPAPGGGCRFRFRVPLAHGAGHALLERPPTALDLTEAGGQHILVVEDNEINRTLVREMLREVGHTVVEAEHGKAGVEQANSQRFDAILMDISMPELDGVEATRRIRQSDGPNRDAPIIALTAHALPEEQAHFVDAGMHFALTKPVRRDELLQRIAELVAPETDGHRKSMTKFEMHLASASEDGSTESDALIDDEVLADLAASLPVDLLKSTLQRGSAEFHAGIDEARALLDANENDAALAVVHRLAGSAAVLGACRLRAHLAEAETAAKSGDWASFRQMVKAADPIVSETASVLTEYADA